MTQLALAHALDRAVQAWAGEVGAHSTHYAAGASAGRAEAAPSFRFVGKPLRVNENAQGFVPYAAVDPAKAAG